jgi:dihydroneopterin aldolase
MDFIRIRHLQLSVFLGVYAKEQLMPRPVVADIELGLDLSRAVASDALSDTVDYDALSQAIRSVCSADATPIGADPMRYALVERLAGDIADICLAFDSRIESVRVTVGKPGAIVGAETVEVELLRRR